eukprot:Plantae.Rhodophyta-Rhodochaete_pulchella.ctg4140.p1 GENE.Plantae.Rhodophyta-Rhodochaete_pulchella.ctg4140~~Plantae.Rhodophyta-Rhodochaete_pulchella.ctg4140.p1  ORF type:complete len:440 (-),score=-0.45 Plantae.Rhodophyta-Rhodochaete_pulchella.ctg4140:556-1875(-)
MRTTDVNATPQLTYKGARGCPAVRPATPKKKKQQYLLSALGTDRYSQGAATYLQTVCSVAGERVHHSPPSSDALRAPLEIILRLRPVPTVLPNPEPDFSPWQDWMLLPEHDYANFVLGIVAVQGCSQDLLRLVGFGEDRWSGGAYSSARFVYRKKDHCILLVARFALHRTDCSHVAVPCALLLLHGLEENKPDRPLDEMVVCRIGHPSFQPIFRASRVFNVAGPKLGRRFSISDGGQESTGALTLRGRIAWTGLREVCHSFCAAGEVLLSRYRILSTGAQVQGHRLRAFESQFRVSLSFTSLGLIALQKCYPGDWPGSIRCVPTTFWSKLYPRTAHPLGPIPVGAQTRHVSREVAPPRFECSFCGRGFSRRHNMTRHINTVHAGQRRFECPICHLRFQFRQHMLVHMDSMHLNRIYPCELCGATFNTKSNLVRHKRVLH